MKFHSILIALSLFATSLAQSVNKVDLTKDNGKGKPGAVVKTFAPEDNPFHCVVHLKPLTATTTFTGTLVAIDAGKVKNYKVAMATLTGLPKMDLVDFKFSLPRPWPTGSYRFDVKANGKDLKSVTFDIK